MQKLPVASRLIREWCDQHRIPHCVLARHLGISKAQLSAYLNAHRYPGVERACAIEEATGIPVQAWNFYEDPGAPRALPLKPLQRAARLFWRVAEP